jgi:hypothetical protein
VEAAKVSVTPTQVLFFLLVAALFGFVYLNPQARERLVANSWQPIPALLLLVTAACYVLFTLDSVVHHRPWLFQVASVVLFAASGIWQLVLLRRRGRFGQ